jgi:hypothetical protein
MERPPRRRRPRPIAPPRRTALARGAAAALALVSWQAAADAETVYKCRKPNGGILYSSEPCETQSAKSVKVLRTDRAQVTIREVDPKSVRPFPDPDRPLTAAEQARYAVPAGAASADPDGVLPPRPVVRTPALDHIARTAADTASWWQRLKDTVAGWFGH